MKFDYLVVGAGLAGAVYANHMHSHGKSVLVIEKRDEVGGNVATELRDGIHVHLYGGHILHSNDADLWAYISRFAEIRQYEHRVAVNYRDKMYSFPINLETYHQVFRETSSLFTTPTMMKMFIESRLVGDTMIDNLQDWCINQIGGTLYRMFIEGYTLKQWGRHPRDLPTSIIRRIPVRYTWDDRYFNDKYQGVPVHGYSNLIENMLDGCPVELQTDYFSDRERFDSIADCVVFTGEIDRYFDYSLGKLEYRSLRHEHKFIEGDYQGCATVNYTDASIPWTRVMEWKYFGHLADHLPHSWVTWEYPEEYDGTGNPCYPIRDTKNTELYRKYKSMSDELQDVVFIGRLATYTYLDMIPCVAQALKAAKEELR